MSNAHTAEAWRATIRTLVTAVEGEISRLPPAADGNEATQGLRASWTALVSGLALGPAPETRECPTCHGIGMRAASRCGDCWTSLPPLPALVSNQTLLEVS